MTTNHSLANATRGLRNAPASRRVRWILLAALLIVLLIGPVLLMLGSRQAPYVVHIAVLTLIMAIVAMSMNMPIRTGYWPVGQSAFMAAGGYTSAILTTAVGLPLVVGFVAGAICGGILAYVFGRITLRLAGTYFVLATFAFGEIVRLTIINEPNVLGGASGITGLPTMNLLEGWLGFSRSATQLLTYYYVALALLIVTVLLVAFVYRSSVGAAFDAMRTNLRLAQAQGQDSVKYRVFAFTTAGVFAGLGGALLTHYMHIASPLIFTYIISIDVLLMNVIGGTRSIAGPLIGAAIIAPLPELLRGVGAAPAQIGYGAAIILVMLLLPGGLVSLWPKIRRWRSRRTRPREATND